MFLVIGRKQIMTGAAIIITVALLWGGRNLVRETGAQVAVDPRQVAAWKQEGILIFSLPQAGKSVCLTFDDGPDPVYTPQFLEILRRYNIKATFFPVGKSVEAYPELARQIVEEGHEIGNHTYSHVYFVTTGAEEIEREILKAQEVTVAAAGKMVKLFRPPGGVYHERLINVVRRLGYRAVIWTWSSNPSDAYGPGIRTIVKRVVEGIADGAVILLHETGRHPEQTLGALPQIVEKLQAQGYRFALVSELAAEAAEGKKVSEPGEAGCFFQPPNLIE